MKRVIATVLTIMMVTALCGSYAESDSGKQEDYLGNLNKMNLYYQLLPDEFSADKILHTYINLVQYMEQEAINRFYIAYGANSGDGKAAVDVVRKYSISNAKIVKIVTDGYIHWLEGSISDSEYLEVLMTIVQGILESSK